MLDLTGFWNVVGEKIFVVKGLINFKVWCGFLNEPRIGSWGVFVYENLLLKLICRVGKKGFEKDHRLIGYGHDLEVNCKFAFLACLIGCR